MKIVKKEVKTNPAITKVTYSLTNVSEPQYNAICEGLEKLPNNEAAQIMLNQLKDLRG